MEALTIGRVAREAGVGVETVRFYERRGLIERPPTPRGGGYRRYPPEAPARIRFVQQAQRVGFSLSEIRELLSLRADPRAECGDVRERAMAKLVEVNRKIADLARVRAALEELVAACPGRGAARACSILEALEAAARREAPHEENDPRNRTYDPARPSR